MNYLYTREYDVYELPVCACLSQMMEYKQKWSESQAELQQQLKAAKKVGTPTPAAVQC